MRLHGLAIFAPEWLAVWFVVAAVGAFILGFRRTGTALLGWPILHWIVLPVIQPILDQQPAWIVAAVFSLVGLVMLQGALSLLFGPAAVGHFIGTYLVRLADLLLLGPLRGARWLWLAIFREK